MCLRLGRIVRNVKVKSVRKATVDEKSASQLDIVLPEYSQVSV